MLGCPWFKPITAWSCIVLSAFGIVILGTLALLFNAKHEELVGFGDNPPASQGPAIAQTIGVAVLIYAGLIACCYGNIVLANRQARRGQIALS